MGIDALPCTRGSGVFPPFVRNPFAAIGAIQGRLTQNALRRIYAEFSEADAERIKAFERTTNHDVKAVEYFIKEKMEALGLAEMAEFIHFGLTSQDVNNTAIPLSIKEATEQVIVPGAAGFAEDPVAASA